MVTCIRSARQIGYCLSAAEAESCDRALDVDLSSIIQFSLEAKFCHIQRCRNLIVDDPTNPLEPAATDVGAQQCPDCLRREQKFKERLNFRVGYLVGGRCDRCVYREIDENPN